MAKRWIVREGYEEVAASYLAARPRMSPDISALAQLQQRLSPGALILDAGCGAGVPILQLLSRNHQVIGVDFSIRQLALARDNAPQAMLVCQDLVELGFAADAFDAVCSYYAIIHVPREEHALIFAAFHRLLRPGGLALLCLGAEDLASDMEPDYYGAAMYWSHFDAATNIELLGKAGFKIIRHELIADSLEDGDFSPRHLFVLVQKPER